MHTAVQYLGLFTASVAFEFAYVAWARSAARGAVWATVAWSVATAALGLAGVGGALSLELGAIPYLAGIGTGAYVGARLGKLAPGPSHA